MSTMRTGERHWLARVAQYFVFWTLKVTMCLYWRECLKTSHQDRLVTENLAFLRGSAFVHVTYLWNLTVALFVHVLLSLSLQAFWAPGDTGVVFIGWCHEPFRLGLKHCPNRR